jgi:hypothetical protein
MPHVTALSKCCSACLRERLYRKETGREMESGSGIRTLPVHLRPCKLQCTYQGGGRTMAMKPALNIVLPKNWRNVSGENPDGPPTFCRENDACGALQVSIQALYQGGAVPNPKPEDLIDPAEDVARSADEQIEIRGRSSGRCALGNYGTVLVSIPEFEWFQVWVLSNGRDFVLATHTCESEPTEDEVNEASSIVKTVTL